MNRASWLVVPLFALLVGGCTVRARPATVHVSGEVSTYGTVYPTVPPPAPIAEYRSPPPGWGYIWVDGYWDWTGYDWYWVFEVGWDQAQTNVNGWKHLQKQYGDA